MVTLFAFGDALRKRLLELGLCEEQIRKLEGYLPLCKSMICPPARMTDVRTLLTDVTKLMRLAKKRLDSIAVSTSKASKEAVLRIEMAGYEPLTDIDPMQEARDALACITETLAKALADLPTRQRRAADANPFPIRVIERALLQGFIEHHQGQRPMPPYMITTSRTQAPFPEIAAIFYEAIGRREPDRAIRKHLEIKKKVKSSRQFKMEMRDPATEEIVKVEATKQDDSP